MHRSSFLAMEKFKNKYLEINKSLRILDIGSYDSSDSSFNYSVLFNNDSWEYVGMDIRDGPNVNLVVSDVYNWAEIDNQSFDVIISGQVFEHIEFFWLTIEEINRVLKFGGLCCIIVPSSGPVHKNPLDCYRFTEDGVKNIAQYVGFDVLESYTNTSEQSQPWFDSVLIAKK